MEALQKLEVWRRSRRLCVDIYKAFGACKDWGFKDQITRSTLSVPSNIAEGYERDFPKECIRFLRIAKGSCGELWTQLHIGTQAEFVDEKHGAAFAQEGTELSKMLQGLIKHYQQTQNT